MVNVNTHLIAEKAEGAKFFEAYRSGDAILIVTPEWLKECKRQGKKVPENEYEVRSTPTVALLAPVTSQPCN